MLKFILPSPTGNPIGKFEITTNNNGQHYYYWPEKRYFLFADNHINLKKIPSDFSSGKGGITIIINEMHHTVGKWSALPNKSILVSLDNSPERYIIKQDLCILEDVSIFKATDINTNGKQRNDEKWNWGFVSKNKDYFNLLISIHYPFTKNDLNKFKDVIVIGSIEFDNPYNQNEVVKPGLIFNKDIIWSNEIVESLEQRTTDPNQWDWLAGNENSNKTFNYDLSKLPVSFEDEVEKKWNNYLNFDSPLSEEEDRYLDIEKFDQIISSLENCNSRQEFTEFELTNIIVNKEIYYVHNELIYDLIWKKINTEITDFNLVNFYNLQ